MHDDTLFSIFLCNEYHSGKTFKIKWQLVLAIITLTKTSDEDCYDKTTMCFYGIFVIMMCEIFFTVAESIFKKKGGETGTPYKIVSCLKSLMGL